MSFQYDIGSAGRLSTSEETKFESLKQSTRNLTEDFVGHLVGMYVGRSGAQMTTSNCRPGVEWQEWMRSTNAEDPGDLSKLKGRKKGSGEALTLARASPNPLASAPLPRQLERQILCSPVTDFDGI